jgi:hypothetical protein
MLQSVLESPIMAGKLFNQNQHQPQLTMNLPIKVEMAAIIKN